MPDRQRIEIARHRSPERFKFAMEMICLRYAPIGSGPSFKTVYLTVLLARTSIENFLMHSESK